MHCLLNLGAYYAEQGNEEQLETLIGDMRDAASKVAAESNEERALGLTLAADAIEAYGWARNGESVERLRALESLRAGFVQRHVVQFFRWWLGELYMVDDKPGEAVVYLETLRHSGVPQRANYLLGKAYVELGEQEKARDAYIRFLQAWEEADPDLPQLEEAREALRSLMAG